jgi:hypothetical protein
MSIALGVVAAAAGFAQIPALPTSGLAIAEANRIAFVDLSGQRVGELAGYRFAPDTAPGLPRFADRTGRLWRLDRLRRRLLPAADGEPLYGGATLKYVRAQRSWVVRASSGRVVMSGRIVAVTAARDVVSSGGRGLDLRTGRKFSVPKACGVGAGARPHWILLCRSPRYESQTPRTIEELVGNKRSVIARPRSRAGHWVAVWPSPDGRTLLAQWSAECETPVAYLVTRKTGHVRVLGAASDESVALGWSGPRTALVHFPRGVCGGTYRGGPGVYAVTGTQLKLVVATTPKQQVAFWR